VTSDGLNGGPPGWRADEWWDDLWENQGQASPLTLGRLLAILTEAIAERPAARDLPFAIELYESTGTRQPLLVSGMSFTGTRGAPDAVTMTLVPATP
jgi:hypothetical protein